MVISFIFPSHWVFFLVLMPVLDRHRHVFGGCAVFAIHEKIHNTNDKPSICSYTRHHRRWLSLRSVRLKALSQISFCSWWQKERDSNTTVIKTTLIEAIGKCQPAQVIAKLYLSGMHTSLSLCLPLCVWETCFTDNPGIRM